MTQGDSRGSSIARLVCCNASLGRRSLSRALVEGFGGDVRTVRPRDSATLKEETLEVRLVLQRFEDRTIEPLLEVHGGLATIAEDQVDAVAAAVLSTYNLGEKRHVMTPYSNGSILSSCSPAFILAQFASISALCCEAHSRISRRAVRDWISPARTSPSSLKLACCPWCSAWKDGLVLSVEHPNHDPEEGGDDRHGLTLHLQAGVGLTVG